MKTKGFLVLLVLGCAFALVDKLAVEFDLEPNEPGYDSYGVIGNICFFPALPFIMARYLFYGVVSSLSNHPQNLRMTLFGSDDFVRWPFDIVLTLFCGWIISSIFKSVPFSRRRRR